MTFDEFRDLVLFRKITKWDKDKIALDNGMVITIEMTESDCCANAEGEFCDVVLDAAITDVTKPEYKDWEDEDTYGCKAVVKFMHNRNIICRAEANADAGNGGYYYSIASFVVAIPEGENLFCHFVGSDDKTE